MVIRAQEMVSKTRYWVATRRLNTAFESQKLHNGIQIKLEITQEIDYSNINVVFNEWT